jgi:ABC-type multidrug transport system fused ATPase/permease subunit
MEVAISLYGYLLITFLGVIVPLLGILLSLFRQGLLELTIQAEREINSSTQNLREQLTKQSESGQPDIKEIKKSIRELSRTKRKAEKKLKYLDPKTQLLMLFALLFLSFCGVIIASLSKKYALSVLVFSLVLFLYALFIMWKLLGILVEVKKGIDDKKTELESKVIELLSSSDKSLKKVYPVLDGTVIDKNDIAINLSLNVTNTMKIVIKNSESKMAKRVELGIIFPREFIIEKGDKYTLFTEEDGTQIIRFHIAEIYGNTKLVLPPLMVKPIKEGVSKFQSFIKGENIDSILYSLLFKVQGSMPPS